MESLANKSALVTGSSRGLGRAMAMELGRRGAHVFVNYKSNQEAAQATAKEIEALGGSATVVQGDVGLADDTGRLVSVVSEESGVDILVNNGGAILRPGAWNEQSDADLVSTINMHLVGPLRLVRALAPAMADRGFGRIVNITSTYGITGAAPVLAYTAAKAALISMTYAMARELGAAGVTVNAIAPGNIDTAMTESAGPDVKDWAISTTPVGRLGYPDEVAHALGYFLENPFVTGHVLVVDGGQILNM